MENGNADPRQQVGAWCERHGLTGETQRVLQQEGFTSVQFLRLLTPEEVDKWFKQRRLLPLAQCLALQQAVTTLGHPHSCAGAVAGGAGAGADERMETASPPSSPFLPEPQHRDCNTTVILAHQQQQQQQQQQRQQYHHQQQQQQQQQLAEELPRTSLTYQGGATAGGARLSQFQEIEEEPYRFLLVGKTGSGKSTTGNSILGADLFDEDVGFDSQTYVSQLKRATVHGRTIEIMDSPGLFDTHRTHEEISVDIVKAVACMHPGPHAILYVIRLGRYTEEEYEVYTRLKALFDHDVTKYVIVVFTGGDGLEKEGKGIEDILRKVPDSLLKVLQECQHRVVVFNNVAHDKQQYVMNLLHEVDNMLAGNGGGHYTCPRYAEVGQGMEEEVARRLNEMEQEQLADKPYVQELKKTAHSAEEKLQEARQLFQQREQERKLELLAMEERAEAEMEGLLEEMKNKDYSMERQRVERTKLLEKHEREKEVLRREMEERREEDQKDMERKEQEMKAAFRKAEEEQQRFLETKRKVYQRKIAQLKDNIVKDQEPNFLDKIVGSIQQVVGKVVSIFPDPIKTVATSFLAKRQK